MLRTRSDKFALAVLIVGLLALLSGAVAMTFGASGGGWVAVLGFFLTFGTLSYAVFFRP